MVSETIPKNESSNGEVNKSIKTVLTKEDIQTIVNRALGSSFKIVAYILNEFPGDNLGFMGAYQNLVITVYDNNTNQEKEYNFFVKSIPYGVESQVSLIQESRAFRKETGYYGKIVCELTKYVEDKRWSAECYLVKNDVMVFENLKSKNFKTKSKFLDVVSAKAALSSLAKLHAASILTEKRLGKSLLELYPEILKDRLFLREGVTYDWRCAGVKVAVAVAQDLKLDPTLIPRVCDRVSEAILPSSSMRNGVCHGDPWSNNLLFNDDIEKELKCVMVDYQLVRYAPIMSDVSLLLYLATRRRFREQHEVELLAYYHQYLCKKLEENEKEIELPTFQEILCEYEQIRVVGVVTALMYYPIIFAESEDRINSDNSSNDYAEMQLGDRTTVVQYLMQKNSFYKEVIWEIVEETVERAEQLLDFVF